jgi:hypothetical protein
MRGTRLLFAAALTVAAFPAPARGQALDETCLLPLTDLDEGATNVLYPDDSAAYYSGAFVAIPGTEIRITGRFPHSRYASFNVYDAALRPVDGLPDVALEPDPGSVNPFRTGADRTAGNRSYSARISFATPPAQRERNTLYGAVGQGGAANPVGVFTYRIYIPDQGRDDYGDVGLPTAEVVQAGSTAPVSPAVCNQIHKPTTPVLNETLAAVPSLPQAEPEQMATGRNPPHWRKFVNVASALGVAFTDNPTFNNFGQAELDQHGGRGGFLSNMDNAYVSALVHRGYGQVLVTRFRAPTFPDTRPGTKRMPTGQLRYWSICQNDPMTQRFVACINDDRAVIGRDGFATYVISPPNERPASATRKCGVNWLPWGPNVRGAVIYRHMLPSAGFGQSIQAATADQEAATMGDVFPVSRYYRDAGAYDASRSSKACSRKS